MKVDPNMTSLINMIIIRSRSLLCV